MADFNNYKNAKVWAKEIVFVLDNPKGRWMSRGQIAQALKLRRLNTIHNTILEMLVLFGYVVQRQGKSDVPNVEFRYEYQLIEIPYLPDDTP